MVALERETPAPPQQSGLPPATADAIPLAARRHGVSPRQVVAAILIGIAVLALLGARDLPSWADRLSDGPFVDRLQDAAGAWDRAMDDLGLTAPHEALHRGMRWLRDREWSAGAP